MRILSHRGLWNDPAEKNTSIAFRRSFESGFGTETDLRDQNGKLVISHDPPAGDCMNFEDFLQIHREIAPLLPLALNVKSDGLQAWIADSLAKFEVRDYFLFDMSVPDMRGYLNRNLKVYGRVSEIEQPILSEACTGIWVDSFDSDWFDMSDMAGYLENGVQICVVSPELHGRDPQSLWNRLKLWNSHNLSICTDLPRKALHFFFD